MAQIRGCLMKIFSPSRQLTYLQSKYLKVKDLTQLIGSELLGQERVGSAFLQQKHFQYQRYCSEASKLEKRQDEDIQIPEDHTAIGDVSKKDIMKSNSISFLLEIITSETRSTHSEKIGLKKSQACFHRLAWLVTENMELKEEKAKELFCDPEFQEISNFIESRVETLNPDYLCSVLGSLLQMTVEDTWLIKRIEMALLQKVEHALTVKQAKGLVEIHADHQETELRQAVFQAAVKVLDDPFDRQLTEMVDWGADASTEEIQELLQEALKNANKLDSVQIYKLFVLMSVKKIRSGPLIDTMISNLGESTLMYTRKELKDIFYALSMLYIQDQTVLEKLTKNVLAVSHRKDRKKLYPILVSCSRLGWKPESLSAIFRNEILYLLSSTAIEPTTLASLVQSLGHLYWTGFGGPEFFELAIKCLENLKDKDPKLWLEAVWSLAIMRRTTEEMIQDVLTDSNCEQIEQSIADKPNHVKVGVMKKLLNLTGHFILERKGANVPSGDSKAKTKPASYDVWMKTLKEDLKNQSRRSSLRKSVEQTLKSLNPVSLTTNKLLDYGHIIDFELQVTVPGETEGAAKKLERVGVKLLDFKAMYRTEGAPQFTGENRMCIRHLRLMDYPFFTVQYNEWLLQDSEDQKRNYLSDRLSTAIQRTRHVQAQNQNKKE